ncbi:hypothetical protein GCM10028807_28520 [Spirosoma daeguense]
MAHPIIESDEQIETNMHGFDPLSKAAAISLIDGFQTLSPDRQLDLSQGSFYIDSDTLDDLLRGERSMNGLFDAIRMMFGVDTDGKMVLLMDRAKVEDEDFKKGVRKFTDVAQTMSIINTSGEYELIEYASLTSNTVERTEFVRVDRDGDNYRQLRLNFEERFENDNALRTYKISAKSVLQALELDTERPVTYSLRYLITGYYIGWGTLQQIRKEVDDRKKGVKLFLGYGTKTLNPESARCFHIVAIAADSVRARIEGYPLEDVWSTQDQTTPAKIEGFTQFLAPTESPTLDTWTENPVILTSGSSCQDETTAKIGQTT